MKNKFEETLKATDERIAAEEKNAAELRNQIEELRDRRGEALLKGIAVDDLDRQLATLIRKCDGHNDLRDILERQRKKLQIEIAAAENAARASNMKALKAEQQRLYTELCPLVSNLRDRLDNYYSHLDKHGLLIVGAGRFGFLYRVIKEICDVPGGL